MLAFDAERRTSVLECSNRHRREPAVHDDVLTRHEPGGPRGGHPQAQDEQAEAEPDRGRAEEAAPHAPARVECEAPGAEPG